MLAVPPMHILCHSHLLMVQGSDSRKQLDVGSLADLIEAALNGELEEVQKLVGQQPRWEHEPYAFTHKGSSFSCTALDAAAAGGKIEIWQWLLPKGVFMLRGQASATAWAENMCGVGLNRLAPASVMTGIISWYLLTMHLQRNSRMEWQAGIRCTRLRRPVPWG